MTYGWQEDTLLVTCKEAQYKIAHSIVEKATGFCWEIPADGAIYEPLGTFAFVSRQAIRALQEKGYFIYAGITWRTVSNQPDGSYLVRADIDQTEMLLKYNKKVDLYLVTEMRNNLLGIDWKIQD